MEHYITIDNRDIVGIIELRYLKEIQQIDRVLNKNEFMEIVAVYEKVLKRLEKTAIEQGINLY